MAFSQKRRKDFSDRKSKRYARIGRETEIATEELLKNAKDGDGNPFFVRVVRHERCGKDDAGGKDFTVTRIIRGDPVSRSFGITISLQSWHQAQLKHAGTPQFCFPIGTKPETILKRTCGLFEPVEAEAKN